MHARKKTLDFEYDLVLVWRRRCCRGRCRLHAHLPHFMVPCICVASGWPSAKRKRASERKIKCDLFQVVEWNYFARCVSWNGYSSVLLCVYRERIKIKMQKSASFFLEQTETSSANCVKLRICAIFHSKFAINAVSQQNEKKIPIRFMCLSMPRDITQCQWNATPPKPIQRTFIPRKWNVCMSNGDNNYGCYSDD